MPLYFLFKYTYICNYENNKSCNYEKSKTVSHDYFREDNFAFTQFNKSRKFRNWSLG